MAAELAVDEIGEREASTVSITIVAMTSAR